MHRSGKGDITGSSTVFSPFLKVSASKLIRTSQKNTARQSEPYILFLGNGPFNQPKAGG
jgi:hypothetical protein